MAGSCPAAFTEVLERGHLRWFDGADLRVSVRKTKPCTTGVKEARGGMSCVVVIGSLKGEDVSIFPCLSDNIIYR